MEGSGDPFKKKAGILVLLLWKKASKHCEWPGEEAPWLRPARKQGSANKLNELPRAPPTPVEQHPRQHLHQPPETLSREPSCHTQPPGLQKRRDNKWVLFRATTFLVICYSAVENDNNLSSKVGIPDPEAHAYRNIFLQKTMKTGRFERTHSKSTQQGGAEPAEDALVHLNTDLPSGRAKCAPPKLCSSGTICRGPALPPSIVA